MKGFFYSASTSTKVSNSLVPQCGACGLFRTCKSPKMKIDGEGRKKILVYGEAPGFSEDEQGIPFCGKSGRKVEETFRKYGVDFRKDCWIGNALRCRPGMSSNQIKNPKSIDFCRPYAIQAIQELKPEKIILLGNSAVRSVIGWLWKADTGDLEKWIGQHIPSQRVNSWLCPTFHPSYVMREESTKEGPLYELFFDRNIKDALAIEGRPWKEVPDYKSKLIIELDPERAANKILAMMSYSDVKLAFDFETDRLKPDHKEASIFCCAVSDGRKSIAFPWQGAAIDAMKLMLQSDVKKVGYSCKFETRFILKEFGFVPRNWVWDGQLAAHTLDNRRGTKSLEFQEFVTLGFAGHKGAVGAYFKASGGNTKNKIREAPLMKTLEYCALDALVEHLIFQEQAKKMGVVL